MLRGPLTSTLFPYTTLFRSAGGIASALAGGAMSKLFGGGFLTASKQFRHGATSKSRSNTASNSTKHKSPHLSRSEERFSRNAETDLVCRLLLEKKKKNDTIHIAR